MICDGYNIGRMQFAPTRDKPHINVVPSSLGAIVRSFKSAVTKFAHTHSEYSNVPIWQRNYYDHVIRNESELFEKRKYIIGNPAKWSEDEYYSDSFVNDPTASRGLPDGYDIGRMQLGPTRGIQVECVAYVPVRHVFVGRRGRPPTTKKCGYRIIDSWG
jgi:hypothetical protein